MLPPKGSPYFGIDKSISMKSILLLLIFFFFFLLQKTLFFVRMFTHIVTHMPNYALPLHCIYNRYWSLYFDIKKKIKCGQ